MERPHLTSPQNQAPASTYWKLARQSVAMQKDSRVLAEMQVMHRLQEVVVQSKDLKRGDECWDAPFHGVTLKQHRRDLLRRSSHHNVS